jgi:hypothetical protein
LTSADAAGRILQRPAYRFGCVRGNPVNRRLVELERSIQNFPPFSAAQCGFPEFPHVSLFPYPFNRVVKICEKCPSRRDCGSFFFNKKIRLFAPHIAVSF